jgi:ectoine hydroxylase-related dioxygenase (phytanoyl-CoA dioxygenase family)
VRLGALEVVPGSHKLGLLTTDVVNSFGKVERFTNDDFIPVEAVEGDVLFFSSFLVHRSGVNNTDSIRWSCHFRYNNLDEPTFVERGYPHPYFYKPQDELITPNFPAPEMLDEFFAKG